MTGNVTRARKHRLFFMLISHDSARQLTYAFGEKSIGYSSSLENLESRWDGILKLRGYLLTDEMLHFAEWVRELEGLGALFEALKTIFNIINTRMRFETNKKHFGFAKITIEMQYFSKLLYYFSQTPILWITILTSPSSQ